MKADTQIGPYKNSLTLTLSQRERGFWGWFSSVTSKRHEPAI